MAQVALSRAQPSSPHRPLSRSSRGRPFIFTSAIARELADRAALTCRFKPLKKTVAIRSSPRRHSVHATECVPRNLLMRMCFLCTLCAVQAQRGVAERPSGCCRGADTMAELG